MSCGKEFERTHWTKTQSKTDQPMKFLLGKKEEKEAKTEARRGPCQGGGPGRSKAEALLTGGKHPCIVRRYTLLRSATLPMGGDPSLSRLAAKQLIFRNSDPGSPPPDTPMAQPSQFRPRREFINYWRV